MRLGALVTCDYFAEMHPVGVMAGAGWNNLLTKYVDGSSA